MSATFITLSKRLTTLENNLKANRLIKPRYYLQEARNKLAIRIYLLIQSFHFQKN